MTYVHIPVPFDAPDIDHLGMFLGVMNRFPDKKIRVHCAVNMRVSAFLYRYQRLVGGKKHEEALRVMLPTWKPIKVWQRFMALELE